MLAPSHDLTILPMKLNNLSINVTFLDQILAFIRGKSTPLFIWFCLRAKPNMMTTHNFTILETRATFRCCSLQKKITQLQLLDHPTNIVLRELVSWSQNKNRTIDAPTMTTWPLAQRANMHWAHWVIARVEQADSRGSGVGRYGSGSRAKRVGKTFTAPI